MGPGEELAVPVIVRSNGIRYSPVRIVEQEIIKKYDVLPQAIFQCITLKSFYLTASEAKLLNLINFNHSNNRYGEAFFSTKDVIISASDVRELSRFLNISHEIFTKDLSQSDAKLGIVRLTPDPLQPTFTLLVPYILKTYSSNLVKLVPKKMVEPYVHISPSTVKATPSDWDIMYLKMLSIYCENNSQQSITREDSIVLLHGLVYRNTNVPIIYEEYKT